MTYHLEVATLNSASKDMKRITYINFKICNIIKHIYPCWLPAYNTK